MLGTERSLIVTGEDGLDEVTLLGATNVLEARDGRVTEFAWRPADFGIEESSLDDLLVEGPEQSAAMVRGVLAGEPGVARNIVIANAAAALWTAGAHETPAACAGRAATAIDDGAAADVLARLADLTNP